MARGRFITLEGGEGVGKTTQRARLAESLRADGREVVETREPGGSPGAEAIRRLLVEGEPGRWDPLTETMLHVAARRDHVRATIRPALKRGAWVISDRFADSTRAYQGYGQGVEAEVVDRLSALAIGDFRPDLTLILDIPVSVGLARAGVRPGSETRYERMGVAFHERLREGFLAIAAAEPDRCVVVDANGEADEVAARILDAVVARLG